jgi:hypothetical protein
MTGNFVFHFSHGPNLGKIICKAFTQDCRKWCQEQNAFPGLPSTFYLDYERDGRRGIPRRVIVGGAQNVE